jgi:hypothetical protein
MSPEDVRLQLLDGGYCPIPLVGKIPALKSWQHRQETTRDEIALWCRTHPAAGNTGILTRHTPTLDIDILDEDAAAAVENLVRERFDERGRVLVRFGRRPKRAILFRTNAPFAKIAVNFAAADGAQAEKLEFLCDGQQVVVEGLHPETQRPYEWFGGSPREIQRDDLPAIDAEEARALIDDIARLLVEKFDYRLPSLGRTRGNGAGVEEKQPGADWQALFDNIRRGENLHQSLRDLAAKMIVAGTNPGAVVNQLRALMEASTGPHDDRWKDRFGDIPRAVETATEKIEQQRHPLPPVEPTPLDRVVAIFREWLALKDDSPVYVTLGTVAANLLPGDPVWLGLIAPPSSAKTELLNAISHLSYVEIVETFSPAALLSGSPKKDRAKGATGGVLRKIGAFGVILFKDFGSVLDLRHEQRADMMTALRRIFDGQYTRQLGTEGGRTLTWSGKAGCIFGSTQAYDSHHTVAGTLGDRFLHLRVETMADEQLAKCRLQNGDGAARMRQKLAQAVVGLFASVPNPLPEPEGMTDAEYASLSDVILKVIRLRAGVVRDGYRREIDDVHDPEGPARLSKALQQLFAGLILIGVEREGAVALVERVAYYSAPKLRLRAFNALTDDWQATRQIASKIKLPTTTTGRVLEELAAQELAVLEDAEDDGGQPRGGARRWKRAL